MEPVDPGGVLGAILGAIADLNEPSPKHIDININAPAEHRPLGFAVPGNQIAVHPSQVTELSQIITDYGMPALNLSFDAEVAEWLAKTTAANIGNTMDMTLCGEVLTSPVIQTAIPGGTIQLTGGDSIDDIGLALPIIAGQYDCSGQPIAGYVAPEPGKRNGSRSD